MSLAAITEAILADIERRAKAAGDVIEEKIDEVVFPPPSDEPLIWEREGLTKGILQVDVPKVAAQLYFGYIAQRVIPRIIANRLQRMRELAEDFAKKRLADAVLGKAARSAGLVRFIVDAMDIFEESEVQKAIYEAITGKSLDYQRELLTLRPEKKNNRKRTEKVYTRKRIPKQRKPNKSWTDAKS